MKPLVVSLAGESSFGQVLARSIDAELATREIRCFPDGETYIRFDSEVKGRDVVVACSLDRPDRKVLPLIFVAETLRELGAQTVGLAAPYLAYMRQDACFRPGESMTSRHFGRLVSRSLDWLVTVDPHLHRYSSLDEIYSIPSIVVPAAGPIAEWIAARVELPLLVGPDEESSQWVSAVSAAGNFPSLILEKTRHGDYDVEISGARAPTWSNQTPVVIDDIISTGRTMAEAIRHLEKLNLKAPICLGIHGIFVDDAYDILRDLGVDEIVTCNTVVHHSNGIDIHGEFGQAVGAMLAATSRGGSFRG